MKKLLLVLFLIVNASATNWYVRSTGGNDANTGLSFAQGLASPQAAIDSADAAGDSVYFCSNLANPFNVTAQIDVDVVSGAIETPIVYLGADLVDGSPYLGTGQAYIVASSSITGSLFFIDYSLNFYKWHDLYMDANSNADHVYDQASTDGPDNWTYFNCTFTNANEDCIRVRWNAGNWFINCDISYAGRGASVGWGIDTYNSGRSGYHMINCNVHHNLSGGARCGAQSQGVFIKGCKFYRNGDVGFAGYDGGGGKYTITDNIFVQNGTDAGGHGCFIDNQTLGVVYTNNISAYNAGYGFYLDNVDGDRIAYMDYNCFYTNTEGATEIAGGIRGTNNVTTDPLFTDTADGSEDYTLQATSPCIDVGLDSP